MPTRGGAAKRAPFVGQCALPGRGLIPPFHCTRLAGAQAGAGQSAVHPRRGDAQALAGVTDNRTVHAISRVSNVSPEVARC
jgi:hypothetical protein